MQFRNSIPEEIFTNPFADKIVSVLDLLKTFKEEELFEAAKFYHPILSADLRALRVLIEDLGYPPVPDDFPKEILDNMILNAQHVNALKGSKLGLKYWLWVLTVGDVTIDDSAFYPVSNYIRPSDDYYGYVSNVSPLGTPDLYLFDGAANFGSQTLDVSIDTPYHTLTSLEAYINEHIEKYISFVSEGSTINIVLNAGSYTTFDAPYQYFVIP